MKTVREQWDTFRRAVMPVDAPPEQRQETRRAFYAGCWSMLQACKNDVTQLPDDQGVQQLQAWEDEIRDFLRAVREGRA